MTGALITTGNQAIELSPAEVIANATTQAKLLMDIVEKTKCYKQISEKKYLQVEAWQTIGAFNRVHAITDSTSPITRDGATVGYDAKVNLVNYKGDIVGAAIMPCYFTENACKGKEGDAKDKACKSAAQTFAESKAYRMNYSYIAILAGYEPTPAEEMTGESTDDRPATEHQKEHWCEKHLTHWFKKGKMKGFAHPIGDSGEWCNEETKQESSPEPSQDAPQATTAPPTPASNQSVPKVSEATYKVLLEAKDNAVVTNAGLASEIKSRGWTAKSAKELTEPQALEIIKWLKSKVGAQAEPEPLPFES